MDGLFGIPGARWRRGGVVFELEIGVHEEHFGICKGKVGNMEAVRLY